MTPHNRAVDAVLAAFPGAVLTARRTPVGLERLWAGLSVEPWMPTAHFAAPRVQRARRLVAGRLA